MDGANIMRAIAKRHIANQERRQGDFIGEDGLLRCGTCGEKRQAYAIMAMERAGLDAETIRKVSSEMTYCFDDTTVAEAADYYNRGTIF